MLPILVLPIADVHDPDAAAVHRGLDHRRQARAPPAAAPAQRPDPHGPDGRADDDVRPLLGGRRQRHHRDQAALVDQPDHLLHAGGGLRRPGDRVPDHPALVHLAAAQGQRDAAARLRDRHHHALPRGRLHRAAPAAPASRGPTRSPPATATRTSTAAPRATDANGVAAPGTRPPRRPPQPGPHADVRRQRAEADRRRSSRRATTTPSTSTSSRRRSRATPADGHQFDGHHLVEDETLRADD